MTKTLATIALILAACTSSDKARRTLDDQGYANIETGGYSFGCAKDDTTCTSFEATAPSGRRVRGAVGCGLVLKGCTVRIDP